MPSLDSEPYREALQYLYSRINYEKIGNTPYTAGHYRLDRMRQLLKLLGEPQNDYAIVHVAGTKGKGTTATLLADCLMACGHRTGLYTSPHLLRLEERIQVNGTACSAAELVELTAAVRAAAERLEADGVDKSTFFELTTAMGMLHFSRRQAQAVVLEVGLGGRLDSTNVCQPLVSVITSISLDHQAQLGNTIAAIAREKAGIIKPRTPVICVARDPEAREAISEVARREQAPLWLIDRDFKVSWQALQPIAAGAQTDHSRALAAPRPTPVLAVGGLAQTPADAPVPPALPIDPATAHTTTSDSCGIERAGNMPSACNHQSGAAESVAEIEFERSYPSPSPGRSRFSTRLLGAHQADNLAAALATLDLLRAQGWQLPEPRVTQAMQSSQPRARMEVVARKPLSIVDSAHNPASIQAGLEALAQHFPDFDITLVFAASRDKDWHAMLRLLMCSQETKIAPQSNLKHQLRLPRRIVLTAYCENPRGLPLEKLAAEANRLHDECGLSCEIHSVATPPKAWRLARELAPANGLVYATGSFFLAAELLREQPFRE